MSLSFWSRKVLQFDDKTPVRHKQSITTKTSCCLIEWSSLCVILLGLPQTSKFTPVANLTWENTNFNILRRKKSILQFLICKLRSNFSISFSLKLNNNYNCRLFCLPWFLCIFFNSIIIEFNFILCPSMSKNCVYQVTNVHNMYNSSLQLANFFHNKQTKRRNNNFSCCLTSLIDVTCLFIALVCIFDVVFLRVCFRFHKALTVYLFVCLFICR